MNTPHTLPCFDIDFVSVWKEQPSSFFGVDATRLNRPGKFLISLHSSLPPETLFCPVLMKTMMMMIINIKKC